MKIEIDGMEIWVGTTLILLLTALLFFLLNFVLIGVIFIVTIEVWFVGYPLSIYINVKFLHKEETKEESK